MHHRGSDPAQDGAFMERGRRLWNPRGAATPWAWLLLGALLVPGAWSILTEEQEELLVELHNHYRGVVSPSASAMLPLKWDPNLKLIAESYAAQCIWEHNPDLEDTGENLFAATTLDLREGLEKWFLEHLDYSFHNNSCVEEKMCGHYTQMVWADTHRLGCAVHLCSSMEGLDWEKVSFLVCNYYPAGNYEDQSPYVEGDWCSSCPENLQKCENNLCVPDTEDDEDEDEDVGDDIVFIPYSTTAAPPAEGTSEEEKVTAAPPTPTEPLPSLDSRTRTESVTALPPSQPGLHTARPPAEEELREKAAEERKEKERRSEEERKEQERRSEEERKEKERRSEEERKGTGVSVKVARGASSMQASGADSAFLPAMLLPYMAALLAPLL